MTEVLQQEPQQNGNIVPSSIDTNNQQNTGNASKPKQRRNSVDPDAQEMLISSLRAQIQDLFAQVSQLNSKLVKSYDRVSDLEDELHVASANLRSSSVKISQLELERVQHLSALNTGLLVEKSHVTTELNRLMEKATEEAAQRGQAESARMAIEKDLDDLSASLFNQANTMVAEARFGKHLSERKVEGAERALKSAEEAVQLMQVQMQSMQAEKEDTEKRCREMEMVMGKGKWVERRHDDTSISLRLLSSHAPYQDFLAFLSHLRTLHPISPCPPAMSTLLPLPFLARLLNEDSEPTVRLDLAPSLNWLSRRSVLAAIHSGQLTIEPISAASLFAEATSYASSTTIAGVHSSNDNISCALCGTPVFPVTEHSHPIRPPVHPSNPHNNSSPWSSSFFKRTSSMGYNSRPPSPSHSVTRSSIVSTSQIYIFRLASLPTSTIPIPSLPISSLSKSSSQSTSSSIPPQSVSIYNGLPSASLSNQSVTIYPLCMSGWCLSRLRTTCTLWAFVRGGIVEKVWEEQVIAPPMPPPTLSHANGEKPSLPPRKRGLWGIASAIGERAASWSEGDKDKTKKPPSLHPQEQRRLPPPPPPHSLIAAIPPPLPKRSDGRSRDSAPKSILPRASIDDPINAQSSPSASATIPSPVPTSPPVQGIPVHVRASPSDVTALPQRSPMRTSLLQDRVRTPSNVPLPDSRPSTPLVPPRTSSPAAIGSGGAPPPLPRRAAARVVRSIAATSASRPNTPVNGLESAVTHSPSTAENISTDPTPKANEKVNENPNANGDDNNAKTEEPADAENPDRPSQASSASDIFVDAPSPEDVLAAVGLVQEQGVKDEDNQTVIDVPVPSTVEPKPAAVNGSDNPDKAETNGEINHSNSDHVNGAVEDAKVDSKAEKVIEETNKRQYVGDGTWEEKTWKELVRLREDMFWARVGGFRD